MTGAIARFIRRLSSIQVATFLLLVIGTVAAVLSIPLLQPVLKGEAPPSPTIADQPKATTPERTQAPEKWVFVGKGGAGVERGLHADFVLVSSIKNLGRETFRVRLANAYSKPQWHNTTLAKVIAVVDCRGMTIRYEEVAAYYRNGGHDGTISADVDDAKPEPATENNFNHHAARYVCQGPSATDREVAEADFYAML